MALTEASAIPDSVTFGSSEEYPTREALGASIAHLPADIATPFNNAAIVLEAGVPHSAAVELRRTLEGAASHFEASGKNLVSQIQDLISRGLVTTQFGDALTHIRKVGNVGAHFSDAVLTVEEVKLASRFTEQLLRNLFEVPGELAALRMQAEETDTLQAES